MAEVPLTTQQYNQLVDILSNYVGYTADQRLSVIEAAGLNSVKFDIDFQQPPNGFAATFIRVLQQRGTLRDTGHPALVNLLRWLATKDNVQGNKRESEFIDTLLQPYGSVPPDDAPLSAATISAGATTSGVPIPILAIFANPADLEPLNQSQERERLHEAFRDIKRFKLDTATAVTVDSFIGRLQDHLPRYLHISGHGTQAGLGLEDGNGTSTITPWAGIAAILKSYARTLECVVVNTCYADVMPILPIRYVVVQQGEVPDWAVLKFIEPFYRALADEEEIPVALERAQASLVARSFDGLLPKLQSDR